MKRAILILLGGLSGFALLRGLTGLTWKSALSASDQDEEGHDGARHFVRDGTAKGMKRHRSLAVHVLLYGCAPLGLALAGGLLLMYAAMQPVEAPISDFTRSLAGILLLSGMGGMMAVLLVSAAVSRLVSQSITPLIARLQESEQSGTLRPDFPEDAPVSEVALLAQGLNRAAKAVSESQQKVEAATLELVATMAQELDARDDHTAGHSDRVSANSAAVARAMGLSEEEIEIIRIGAKLHNIGKISVPDTILQKPGELTAEELAVIRRHPQIGKRILEKIGRLRDYLPIVELHHEDFNGQGYPHGLQGDKVPLGARIVHVADAYDAITSNRSFRKAVPESQVRGILESGAGTRFDPEVVRVLLAVEQERRVLESVLEDISSVMERPELLSGESLPRAKAAS